MSTSIDMTRLLFRGTDAAKFLQGQLSGDLTSLAIGGALLAGLHNPQGRVIALLELTRPVADDIVATLPADLADMVSERLRRFVLRAKLTISRDAAAPALSAEAHTARIAAGLPQVYRATSEQFVAQMLNLDLIGAISFSKGCYTGQEIIARSHYRGRVKRRMQRFMSTLPATLAPGESHRLSDGRNARIVDAITRADGRAEFLAVVPLPGAAADVVAGEPQAASAVLECVTLPLPYALPE
jgi:folate-binding protein YgfZ